MDGGGLGAAGFGKPLGRPAGGGREGGAQLQMVEQRQNAPERGGFSGARPAGEEHHLPLGGGFHRLHLQGGVGETLFPLNSVQERVQVLWGAERFSLHLQQGVGHIGLAVVEPGQVAGILAGNFLPNDGPAVRQALQMVLQHGGLRPQQPLGGGQKLGIGEKNMAVVQVVREGVEKPRLQAQRVVRLQSQLPGQLVRGGEGGEEGFLREKVGVGPQGGEGQVSIPPVQGHGQGEGEPMGGEKIQQPPHGKLHTQGLVDGLRPFGGDALHLGEPAGGLLDHRQHILPKGIQQPPGHGGPHPLHRPGGQVFQQGLFPHRHPPLHDLRPELLPVGAVTGPLSVNGQALPRADARHGAHHGDLFPCLRGLQAQNGIAVLLIAVDDGGDGAVQ